MIRKLLLVSASLSMAGCVSLLPGVSDLPPRVSLDAGTGVSMTGDATHDATLVLADPTAAAAFNTFSVAIATGPLEYEYLADAEWTDRVPVLVRRFLERRIQNRNLFSAVGDRTMMSLGDYTLQTDIRAFFLDRSGGSEYARVVLGVRLQDRRGKVIGMQTFSAIETPTKRSRQARVQAFNRAMTTVTDDIIAWVDNLATAQSVL